MAAYNQARSGAMDEAKVTIEPKVATPSNVIVLSGHSLTLKHLHSLIVGSSNYTCRVGVL